MTPLPAQTRREEQRSSVRRSILDATQSLLVERGYEAFSMRRLAERCGYTAPTIYHHFGDKPRLIDALLEERFTVLLGRLRRVRHTGDAVEKIRSLANAFVEFALRNPTHYRLLSLPRGEQVQLPPSAEEAVALVQAPLEELARAGRLRAPSVTAAYQAIWVTLHGLISLRLLSPSYPWEPGLAEVAIDSIARGLVEPEPPRRARRRR